MVALGSVECDDAGLRIGFAGVFAPSSNTQYALLQTQFASCPVLRCGKRALFPSMQRDVMPLRGNWLLQVSSLPFFCLGSGMCSWLTTSLLRLLLPVVLFVD